jgi:lysophospholipase L1-like esterase
MKRILLLAFILASFNLQTVIAQDTSTEGLLPKVLIIGDSISIGYTPYVTQLLTQEALVKHNQGNAQHTGTGLKDLDRWLGDTKWDVIHFNWGLWDLCYRSPESKVQGQRDKIHGSITTPLKQYQKNLEQLVRLLEKTGAKLIWADTTIVPEGDVGRFVGDDKKYNEVAASVMKKHGITIDDLYKLTKGFPSGLFAGPGNVHYTQNGYKIIAGQVTDIIRSALKGEQDESTVPSNAVPVAPPDVR